MILHNSVVVGRREEKGLDRHFGIRVGQVVCDVGRGGVSGGRRSHHLLWWWDGEQVQGRPRGMVGIGTVGEEGRWWCGRRCGGGRRWWWWCGKRTFRQMLLNVGIVVKEPFEGVLSIIGIHPFVVVVDNHHNPVVVVVCGAVPAGVDIVVFEFKPIRDKVRLGGVVVEGIDVKFIDSRWRHGTEILQYRRRSSPVWVVVRAKTRDEQSALKKEETEVEERMGEESGGVCEWGSVGQKNSLRFPLKEDVRFFCGRRAVGSGDRRGGRGSGGMNCSE